MDVTPITTPILQIMGAVVAALLPMLIYRGLSYFGLQNNAVAHDAAMSLAKAAAGQVYHQMAARNLSLSNVRVSNTLIAGALAWACKEAPDAEEVMARAGWDQEHMQSYITAQLGHMLASDPTATITPDAGVHDAKVPDVTIAAAAAAPRPNVIDTFTGMPKTLAVLLVLIGSLFGLAACATGTPQPAAVTFDQFVGRAMPVVDRVETFAKLALETGAVPARDVAMVQMAIRSTDAARAALAEPGNQDPRVIARNTLNAVDALVGALPGVPENIKLLVDLADMLGQAYIAGMPAPSIVPASKPAS